MHFPLAKGPVQFVTPAATTAGNDLLGRRLLVGGHAASMKHIEILKRHSGQMRPLQSLQVPTEGSTRSATPSLAK